jgi:hypothetical protein
MATRARVVWFWLATPSAGGSVQVVPSPTVNVRNAANTANISDTIYAADDPDPTILPQGFLGTANGEVEFYLEDAQRVTLRLSKTGFTSEDIPIDATFPANRFNPRGAWDVATAYDAMDVVSRSGTSWVALRANTGVTPVEGADWTVMAAAGELTQVAGDARYQVLSAYTTAGSILVGTGAGASAQRIPSSAIVATSESTTSTSYTSLTTAGPAVTVTTGTTAIVILTAQIWNTEVNRAAYMGYTVSGASTVAADDARALIHTSATASAALRASQIFFQTGLTAGSNTFTAQYKKEGGSGSANFRDRQIVVIPL